MNDLIKKLKNRENGIVLYSLTPPGRDLSAEKLETLNKRRAGRIETLRCDGISLYDVQEEKGRTESDRTYKYKPAMNPLEYSDSLSSSCSLPPVLYLVSGKYSEEELTSVFEQQRDKAFVLVGSSSHNIQNGTSLQKAYKIASEYDSPLGGVFIGERHREGNNEVHRLMSKIEKGADFFISQCIYDGSLYKELLRDYKDESERLDLEIKPLIFTFSPVGTEKALDFMRWLGVGIPENFTKGIENSQNFLDYSIDYLEKTAEELIDFCLKLQIPFGVNFESIIGKREEVLASLTLADRVTSLMNRKLSTCLPAFSQA